MLQVFTPPERASAFLASRKAPIRTYNLIRIQRHSDIKKDPSEGVSSALGGVSQRP